MGRYNREEFCHKSTNLKVALCALIVATHNENIAKGIKRVYFLYMNDFEYDPRKSQLNLEKHGIDFDQAQALWQDADLIEVVANTSDEPRSLVIGRLDNKHWSAIITYRKSNIRIISVRRSRKSEVSLYES